MRLITYYRKSNVGDELGAVPNLVASVFIISIVVAIVMEYGELTIHHVKAISAFDILPYKEDYAVRFAITGERRIEVFDEGAKFSYASLSHTQDHLEYQFTDNPIIQSVTWHVEESAPNAYLFLSWRCKVSYAITQNDWLLKTFNGNALLCK